MTRTQPKPKPARKPKRVKRVRQTKGYTVTATVGVDVARISLDVECDEPVNFESGRYRVTFVEVK